MAIANVNQITSMLRMLDDRPQNPELQRYAQLHKNDPFLFPLIVAEDTARKAMRAAAQARAMGGEPPKVNDQAVASIGQQPVPPQGAGLAPAGLPTLRTGMANMADGGIAGYPDEDEVGMAEGGVTRLAPGGSRGSAKDAFIASYGPLAQQVGAELGVAPEIILSQWGLETAWGDKTVGDYNFGNIKDVSGKGPRAYDKAEGSRDVYKEYASPEAFAADYVGLIKRRFPEAVGAGADVNKFTSALKPGQQGGFATDKDYGKKLANTLTSLVPVGSAQAAQPAAQAAQAAPVPAPQGGALAGFGKGLASLADVLMAPVPFAVKQVGYAASRPFMSAAEAEKLSSETAAPFQDIVGKTFGVTQDPAYQQEMSRRVAGFIGENINKGSSWIAKQLGIPEEDAINMVNTLSVAGPQAVTGVSKIPAAGRAVYERVAPQKGKLTPQQIERLAEENRVAEVQRAQREAMAGGATLEEQAGLAQLIQRRQQAERPSAAYALQQRTQAQPQGRILAGASKTAEQAQRAAAYGRPDVAAAEGQAPPPAARGPMSDAERAKFMEANTQELASSLPKDDQKDLIDAAKAATPKAERKGLTNDDYLVMGLSMMANPGRGRGLQGLLEAVGTGGMAAVQSKLAREKTEREMAKEESEAKYREALGEQARRGPSEIALIERVAKENNISFTKALELVAGAKREPQTDEALMKAWSSSAFLQMQYPNPQDYIKLMRASTGGASQTSAADQALVSKYLNPR